MKKTFLTSWVHLREEVLAAAALQLQNGDTSVLSPASHAHLAHCGRCAARLDDLQMILADQRTALADAVDARFPQAALDAQRHGILARLAERHAGARVLRFPTAVAVHLPQPRHPMMRGAAGAIAAGLFVAVVSGQALYTTDALLHHVTPDQTARHISLKSPHAPRWKVESGPDATPADERDERFLGEIENSLARGRRNPALRALDEMTPRIPGAQPRRHRER